MLCRIDQETMQANSHCALGDHMLDSKLSGVSCLARIQTLIPAPARELIAKAHYKLL
jgi:hypothetical protein